MAGTEGEAKRIEAIQIRLKMLEEYSVEYRVYVQGYGWQKWKHDGEVAGTVGESKRIEAIQIRLVKKEKRQQEPEIKYQVHGEDYGWQNEKEEGVIAGTQGENKRIEAIKINISGVSETAKIKYMVHVQDYDWQPWGENGTTVGTEGKSKRIEAIKIKIENLPGYTVEYRVHVQDEGWQKWKNDGEVAGTEGKSKRIEAIQIKIVKTEERQKEPEVIYQAYGQDYGWQKQPEEGYIAGTVGEAKRIEALKIDLHEAPENANIKYRAHVQNIGWQDWVSKGEIAGSQGKSQRIEAIQIKLEGLDDYTVEYQVHIQDKGWSAWYIDAEVAGTVGKSKRIEAIKIRIVPKYKREYTGIDVSEHQKTIDYDQLMATGKIDFMIIRAGYGRNSNQKDNQFERNYAEAKKRNIPIGAYLYSYATDGVEGAKKEAYNMLGFLEGKDFELPIFYDIEDPSQQGIDRQTQTEMCLAFGRIMQQAGYKAGIYSSKNWLINNIDLNQIPEDFSIWVAAYGINDGNIPNDKYKFPGYHDIWQYTSTGTINGIQGTVDMNICYRRYF